MTIQSGVSYALQRIHDCIQNRQGPENSINTILVNDWAELYQRQLPNGQCYGAIKLSLKSKQIERQKGQFGFILHRLLGP